MTTATVSDYESLEPSYPRTRYRLLENFYTSVGEGYWRRVETREVDRRDFEVLQGGIVVLFDEHGQQEDITHLCLVEPPLYELVDEGDPKVAELHADCGPCEAGLPPETHSSPTTRLQTIAGVVVALILFWVVAFIGAKMLDLL